MNIYTLSTGCYSGYSEWKLCHDRKVSKEEFDKIVKDICLKLHQRDDYLDYGSDIAKVLINEYGFKTFKYINCHAFDYSFKPDGDEDDLPKTREVEDDVEES